MTSEPRRRPRVAARAAPLKTLAFDPLRYLTDETAIAEYRAAATDCNHDAQLQALVEEDIRRARAANRRRH